MKKTPYEITKKEIGRWPSYTCPSIDSVIDELTYQKDVFEARNEKIRNKLERLRDNNEKLRIKLEEWRDAYKQLSEKYIRLEEEYDLKFRA